MTEFETLRFKNVLSFGDNWTTIPLNAYQHTLVMGGNGCGKTGGVLDTLTFALFGKPFRNINKPTFINSINERDLLVELTFRVNNHQYMIERGMKPTKFTITRDGQALDEEAATKDTQKYLEEQILGFDEHAFRQVIVLGSTRFTPFMDLTAKDRRLLVEDLLGIQVFSMMNVLLKKQATDTAEEITALQSNKTIAEERRRIQQVLTEQYQHAQQAHIQSQIDLCHEQIDTLNATIAEQTTGIKDADTVQAQLDATEQRIFDIEKGVTLVAKKMTQFEKSQSFYTDHVHCPTCTQNIDETFRNDQIAALATKIEEHTGMLTKAREGLAKLQVKKTDLTAQMNTINRAKAALSASQHTLQQTQRSLARLEADLVNAQKPLNTEAIRINDEEIATIDAQLATLSRQRHIQDLGLKILKDSGIKTKVIAHYLPIINRLANQYLQSMDFPIQFTLDEQFNEHIQSRFRTKWSHENFSDGQKKRIDLALLFTWRDIARIKNSCYTNLLIMDEVLDSSLDASGTEDLLKILHALPDDTHVFVISHKDAMVDKFSHVLQFEMQKGFSQMKVVA